MSKKAMYKHITKEKILFNTFLKLSGQEIFVSYGLLQERPVLEFLNNLKGLGTEQEQGCRTGPPGYAAWRNWFLGIDFWAPSMLKIRLQDWKALPAGAKEPEQIHQLVATFPAGHR